MRSYIVGEVYMKTKIIYISGSEVFEMADVRAAFEEVRSTLGLDKDTILFGVPVDADNALTVEQTKSIIEPVIQETHEIIPEPENITPTTVQITQSIEIDEKPTEIVKKPKNSRTSKKQNNADVVVAEQDASGQVSDQDKVIPILSVLANKNPEPETVDIAEDLDTNTDVTDVPSEPQMTDTKIIQEDVHEPEIVQTETVIISDINIDSELVAPGANENIEKITIGDMINDDAPVAQTEKTLEQLLESMTPLREDHETEMSDISAVENTDDLISPQDVDNLMESDDTDATLAQLASEFAQTEDKISSPKKTESQGKIGKLKNILPFKKIKRDDNGLMGDLFGWAGIAANDDDFSMPGFFTGAKKQGM